MKVTILSNGKPLADRRLTIGYPGDFEKDGFPVTYVASPVSLPCDTWFQTDAKGQATVNLGVPTVHKDLQARSELHGISRFDEKLFPFQGLLFFTETESGKTAEVRLQYRSPFPRVYQMALPTVKAGTWQSSRSNVKWRNPTKSKKFHVQIRFPGTIHIPRKDPRIRLAPEILPQAPEMIGGDASYFEKKISLPLEVQGPSVHFGVKPAMSGDDFSDIPDFEKELWKAYKQTAQEYLTTRLGGAILDNATSRLSKGLRSSVMHNRNLASQSAYRAKTLTHRGDSHCSMAKNQMALARAGRGSVGDVKEKLNQARKCISGARGATRLKQDLGKTANVLNKVRDGIRKPIAGMDKDVLLHGSSMGLEAMKGRIAYQHERDQGIPTMPEGMNSAIGLAETGESLYNAVHGFEQMNAEKVLLLKLAWNTAKTSHACYKDYAKTALGWRDVTFMPCTVEVTNDEGFTYTARRSVPVHFDRKNKTDSEWGPLKFLRGEGGL